jgi:tetratricopeptide (TPR) repeat protein
MEMLAGVNPFFYQSPEQILALHDKSDFLIKTLPHWQQEIILKAINKVPELRFQSMGDFAAAIKAKHVPMIWNRDIIRAGKIAEKVEKSLSTKKWVRAGSLLEFAAEKYPDNVNVLRALGKYYLMQQKITKAKEQYEKALRLNPRLDVQKDLGWIHLALKVYPTAISLLSDHLHRNPSDFEAYNLLLQCFYETDRYEAAMDLARALLDIDADNPCFANNLYIACVMQNIGRVVDPASVLKAVKNDFVAYNFSVVSEPTSTHAGVNKPTLKSKLLFMDYRFRKMARNTLYLASGSEDVGKARQIQKLVVTFGRQDYDVNDVQVTAGTSVSRRHCLIVNCKDDVWLYDLESTGTYLNDERVKSKAPMIGLNTLRIGGVEYRVTTDRSKLL